MKRLALELLEYIKGNMEGVGTVSVPFHISQLIEAIAELKQLQAENRRLKEYLKGDCESCFYAGERSITSRECQKCKLGGGYKWKFKDATDGKEDTKP